MGTQTLCNHAVFLGHTIDRSYSTPNSGPHPFQTSDLLLLCSSSPQCYMNLPPLLIIPHTVISGGDQTTHPIQYTWENSCQCEVQVSEFLKHFILQESCYGLSPARLIAIRGFFLQPNCYLLASARYDSCYKAGAHIIFPYQLRQDVARDCLLRNILGTFLFYYSTMCMSAIPKVYLFSSQLSYMLEMVISSCLGASWNNPFTLIF